MIVYHWELSGILILGVAECVRWGWLGVSKMALGRVGNGWWAVAEISLLLILLLTTQTRVMKVIDFN